MDTMSTLAAALAKGYPYPQSGAHPNFTPNCECRITAAEVVALVAVWGPALAAKSASAAAEDGSAVQPVSAAVPASPGAVPASAGVSVALLQAHSVSFAIALCQELQVSAARSGGSWRAASSRSLGDDCCSAVLAVPVSAALV